jgi:hypothetical protein
MVPDIKQNQMADFSLTEGKMIRVLHTIQPRIRENIGRDALRNVLLDIAHARSEFHDETGKGWVHSLRDLAIKLGIHPAQERFFLPELAILEDFDIMLFKARGHGDIE